MSGTIKQFAVGRPPADADGKAFAVLDTKDKQDGTMRRVAFYQTWREARDAARKLNEAAAHA